MDFFEHQDAARLQTRRLVGAFVLAVALIVLAVYVVTRLIFFNVRSNVGATAPLPFWDRDVFLITAAVTLLIILSGTLYKIAALREGGEAVARLLGGRPIDPSTSDLAERRLWNIVEEMAIAAGLPVPRVFVLEKEEAINAFAAGHDPGDAVIGVTGGALRQLSRDELQGVIGHEFSHLLHGDARLNLRLIGLLHGILVIALIGYWILRSLRHSSGSSNKKGGGLAIVLFGVALVTIGYIGVFFGRLIKSAVSRQREFLADAAAVQFTRNPDGLAGALKRILGGERGSRLETPRAEEASHLYFSDGLKRHFYLLATHPPLGERIRRLDPSFTGTVELPQPAAEDVVGALLRAAGTEETAAAMPVLAAAAITSQVGHFAEAHVEHARALLDQLPESLHERVHRPLGARAIVYSLVLDADPEIRHRQRVQLAVAEEAAVLDEIYAVEPLLPSCPLEARLALVDLALPALRQLTRQQYAMFEENLKQLVAADAVTSLFELALQRLLRRHLASHFGAGPRQAVQYYSLARLGPQCSTLLAALAHAGHPDDAEAAARAFARGAEVLARTKAHLLPEAQHDLLEVDHAFEELDKVAPLLKRQLLEAAAATVLSDQEVTLDEGQLLRAVADALGCPLPPFLPSAVVA